MARAGAPDEAVGAVATAPCTPRSSARRRMVDGTVSRRVCGTVGTAAPQRRHRDHSAGTGYLQLGHSTGALRTSTFPDRTIGAEAPDLHSCARIRPRAPPA